MAQKKEIYARASALTEGGQLSAAALNGIIDVNRVQILSTMSNWRTDEQGNMLFEALDGESAMMLSGSGFAIASGRREDGSWDWRTFGTGKGFTADEINAGTLNAGQITILGTDDFFWDADSIRIYTDESGEKQIRIGRYNGVDYGIGFTNDGGMTWQTALTSEGLAITEGSITVDKLAPNVGAQLDLSSNTTITLDVSALENRMAQAELKLEPDQIVATVRGSQAYQDDQSALESSVTAVGQTANKIYWLIDSGSTQNSMQMTDKALEVIASDIDLTGKVTFSALSSDAVSQINQGAVNTVETGLANGTTTINGGCITTGTINGNQVNVTNLKAGSITSGTMSADRISGGTIDARDVSITNLNASNITSGMLSADRIDVSTLKPDRIVSATNNNSYFTITNNGLDFYWEGSYMGRIYVDSYGAMGIMGQSAAILKSSGGVVISGGNAGLIEISDDPK